MRITVHFHSYFKDLTGCATTIESATAGETMEDLLNRIAAHHPKLGPLRNSTLSAVGVDYQGRDYVLKDGDEVSLFPPVQGG